MPINSFENYPMSWKPQLSDRTAPIYLKLAKQLEQDIKTGKLKPGDKLPPQRELADFLDLNLSTITRTYKICLEKGLICAKVGQGTFISSDVNSSDILLYSHEQPSLIEMGTVHPPYNENKKIISFIKNILTQPDINRFLEYRSPAGTMFQRNIITNWLQNFNIISSSEQILFATGGQNALCAILLGVFSKGDRIGTDPLSFTGLKSIAKMLGIKLMPLPTKNYRLDFENIESFCQTEKIKGLYFIPEQHNPTTLSLSDNDRKFIANLAKKLNLVILEDGINKVFREEQQLPILSYAPENTIYIFSTSKFLSAGLRIAYIISSRKYKSLIENALYNMNLMVSPFSLEIVSKILSSDLIENIIKEKKLELIKRNKMVNQILENYTIYGEETCSFRWILLPNEINGIAFEKIARVNGVQVFSAERFIIGNAIPPSAIRLCISAPKNIKDLSIGLHKIKKLLSYQCE